MSVPINGSRAPKQLNMQLPAGGMIKDFAISPDGKFVVYSANQRAVKQFELYTVTIGGGTPRLISVLPGNVGNVDSFQISPDSSHVVYRYEYYPDDPESPVVSLFYSVPIRGGATFKLNQTISPNCAGNSLFASPPVFTPNGQYVLFQYSITDEKSGCVPNPADQPLSLYSVPVAGGTARFLTTKFAVNLLITSNSSTVIFTADMVSDPYEALELYSVPVTGGSILRLSQIDEIISENSQDVRQYDLAAPYPMIVYAYRRAGDSQYYASEPRYFGFVLASGNRSFEQPVNQSIINFKISPNNQGLVYQVAVRNEEGSDTLNKLFSITVQNNGQIGQLSSDATSVLDNYQITADGQTVVYLDTAGNLFSVSLNGGTSRLLAQEVPLYVLSPNGQTVAYPAQPEGIESFNSLKVTSVLQGSTRTLVPYGVDAVSVDKLRQIVITADNRRVTFIRGIYDQNGNLVLDENYIPVEQLFSVALPNL
jgi:hypothetical protein